MTKTVFLSYATGNFQAARDLLCESARSVGFTETLAYNETNLNPDFATRNADILSQKRGGGFWLWKPQVILQVLQTLSQGDVLVYCDAGRSNYYQFTHFPERLIDKTRSEGFLTGAAIRQHGPLSRWTKRDAFLRLGMDTAMVHNAPVVQATWSMWTPTPEAFAFLKAWIKACEDPHSLTDMPNIEGHPNLPDFKDHRHDQSLSSLLTHKLNAPHLDYENTTLFRILALRPNSKLSHHFLKRIDDAEAMECKAVLPALWRSFKLLRSVT